jgi:dihydroceramidase
MSPVSETIGHWLPHTSSIDFCEPDYLLNHYVAEPFNVASSVFIMVLGLCGLLHSNPTQESMFSLHFVIVIAVGLGSVLLHTTLQAFPQSLDEVPMMWFNVLSYYIIMNMKKERRKSQGLFAIDSLGALFLGLASVETYIYYSMRWLYAVFLFVYISTTLGVNVWSIRYTFDQHSKTPEHTRLAKSVFLTACVAFFLIGGVCWLIDMNLCGHLLPVYHAFHGATLHIIWHITAGYGGYLQALTLVVARAGELNMPVHLEWRWAVVPVIVRSVRDKSE